MFKSYFVKENARCNVGDRFFHYYDPHIILLKETAEEFTLSLYEKLFELTSQNKSIDLDQLIEVSGVQIELCDVLENFKGDFNYSIKEPEIFDIETVHVKKISDGIKFFVLQKYYLPDTEDDFEITFSLVECESIEKFNEIFAEECEKAGKKDESVHFSGLFFDFEDAYEVKFVKKKKKIIQPRFPKIVELV